MMKSLSAALILCMLILCHESKLIALGSDGMTFEYAVAGDVMTGTMTWTSANAVDEKYFAISWGSTDFTTQDTRVTVCSAYGNTANSYVAKVTSTPNDVVTSNGIHNHDASGSSFTAGVLVCKFTRALETVEVVDYVIVIG